MPRARSPDSIKAEELYVKSNGMIELVEIAKQLNIPEGTVRSWKNRHKWDDKINATLQKKNRNVAKGEVKKSHTKKEPELEVVENNELTDKQRFFCIYYVKYFNATKAYQKAYECSYETAVASGSRLLGNVKVKEEITKLKADKLKGAMMEPGDLLQKYIDIAFTDITDFVVFGQEEVPVMSAFGPVLDKDGEPVTKMINTVKFRNWTNVDGTLISEIGQGKDGAKLKLYDKMKALDFLAKHMGLLSEETKVKLRIEEERLKLDKLKVTGEGEGNGQEAIDEFIKATTMSEDEIKAMFEGEEDETIQE